MSGSFDGLPALLAEIAEVAGLQAAFTIAEKWGGGRLSIPAKVTDDHPLAKAIGREAADKLCEHFKVRRTGQYVEVPLGPAGFHGNALGRRIRLAKQKGLSDDHIARDLGISRRTVLRHKKRDGTDDQPELL